MGFMGFKGFLKISLGFSGIPVGFYDSFKVSFFWFFSILGDAVDFFFIFSTFCITCLIFHFFGFLWDFSFFCGIFHFFVGFVEFVANPTGSPARDYYWFPAVMYSGTRLLCSSARITGADGMKKLKFEN